MTVPLSRTSPRPPVHRMVRGRSSAIVARLDDRRPVGGASSYRAAATVASIFSRPAARSAIPASHRRDDLVPREEPHVLFACVASALKGLDRSAQGKATRVVRASPSPWVAYHCGAKALKGRDNRCTGLCRPFRASGPIRHRHPGRRYTLPRADLSLPLRDATPQPGRIRTLAGSTVPTASGPHTERVRRPTTPKQTDPIEASDAEPEKTGQQGFQRFRGLPTNDTRHRAATMTPSIFQDRNAAPVHAIRPHRSSAAGPTVGDHRPSGRPSSYRTAEAAAIILCRGLGHGTFEVGRASAGMAWFCGRSRTFFCGPGMR
jgi:hypothetical protein